MNIALSSVLIFFVLLPGVFFRKFYYTEEFSKEYFTESFFELFFTTFIPGIFLHLLWIFLISLLGYSVDFVHIGRLLVGDESSIEAFININDHIAEIAIYNFTLFAFSGFLGRLSKQIVRNNKWDRKYKFFRYRNNWHYILKGEFFEFPRAAQELKHDKVEDIEVVYVDILCEISNGMVNYSGILIDYELQKNNDLKLVELTEVFKSGFFHDKSSKTSSQVVGHTFVIPFSCITNINFTYCKVKKLEDNKYKVSKVT